MTSAAMPKPAPAAIAARLMVQPHRSSASHSPAMPARNTATAPTRNPNSTASPPLSEKLGTAAAMSRVTCPACGFPVQEGAHLPGIRPPAGLAGRERKLFSVFALNLGRVVPYVDLALAMWPADDPDRWMATIRVYICRLRRKIAGAGLQIRVERDFGYRMTESKA